MGSFGFTLIAIAAVLSTGPAMNATLYGAAKVSFVIAKEGEIPEKLENSK
jgi:amino acid transporter